MSNHEETKTNTKKQPEIIITNLLLQSPVMFAGHNESTINNSKIPGIEMQWINGVGVVLKKGKLKAIVPDTNVKIAVLKEQE